MVYINGIGPFMGCLPPFSTAEGCGWLKHVETLVINNGM
jgi:hypothetical protein